MGQTQWSQEVERKMVEQYQGGWSVTKLCDNYHGSTRAVRKVLRQHGVYRGQLRSRVPSAQLQAIVDEYRQGIAVAALSKKYRVAEHSLYRLIKNADAVRSKFALSPEQEQEMIERYQQKELAMPALAQAFSVCTHTIRKTLRRHGLYQGPRRLSAEERVQLVQQYQDGLSVPQLSHTWGKSENSLYAILREAGVVCDLARYERGKAPYVPPPKFNVHEEQQILQVYISGVSASALARRYKCSAGTIHAIVRRHDGVVRSRGATATWSGPPPIHARYPQWWRARTRDRIGGYTNILLDERHPFFKEMTRDGGYVFEHRLVVAEQLNRPLLSCESVHHRNGLRDHNDPDNLELWNVSIRDQPAGQRVSDLIKHYVQFHRPAVEQALKGS